MKSLVEEKRKTYLKFRRQTITYAGYKTVSNSTNIKIEAIVRKFCEKYRTDVERDLHGKQKTWNMT